MDARYTYIYACQVSRNGRIKKVSSVGALVLQLLVPAAVALPLMPPSMSIFVPSLPVVLLHLLLVA